MTKEENNKLTNKEINDKNNQLLKEYNKEGITEEERKLLENDIYKLNEGLVYFVANKYFNEELKDFIEDIESTARFALVKAIRRYSPKYNVNFSTFAVGVMKNAIIIDLPQITGKNSVYRSKIEQFSKEFVERNKRKPTIEEICSGCGIDINIVLNSKQGALSLEYMRECEDDYMLLINTLVDDQPTVEEVALLNENREFIRKIVDALPERRREFIKLKYFDNMTNKEIAEIKGYSKQSASIEDRRALAKFKKLYFLAIKKEEELERTK